MRVLQPLPEPVPLSADQKYLHGALAVTFRRCATMRPHLRHVDYLRVLETYREMFTQDLMERHPQIVPHLSALLKGKR